MTTTNRVAVLERIAKYAREDGATTPGYTRLARALAELDGLPAEPDVVWVVTYEILASFLLTIACAPAQPDLSLLCGVYASREAAVSLVGGFGADTSADPGGDEVTWYDKKQGARYTVSRREVMT